MSIASVPPTLTLNSGNSWDITGITFAIPAGSWTDFQLDTNCDYASPGGRTCRLDIITSATTISLSPSLPITGANTNSTSGVSTNATWLTAINAAAGGNLSVEFFGNISGSPALQVVTVNSFTLTLTGTATVTESTGSYRLSALYSDPSVVVKTRNTSSASGQQLGPFTGGYGTVRNGSKTHVSSSPRARL